MQWYSASKDLPIDMLRAQRCQVWPKLSALVNYCCWMLYCPTKGTIARGQPMTLAKTPEILPTGPPTGSPDCFYQQYGRTKNEWKQWHNKGFTRFMYPNITKTAGEDHHVERMLFKTHPKWTYSKYSKPCSSAKLCNYFLPGRKTHVSLCSKSVWGPSWNIAFGHQE